jgi:4a-hydroxytetrahydrobiopterin dehydratase
VVRYNCLKMTELSSEKCTPIRKGAPRLSDSEITSLQLQIPGWAIVRREGMPQLERVYQFKDFGEALAFTDKLGELAQIQDHHPAILTEWGKVTVTWWTHATGGLHRNDFIMAARTDALFGS